MDGANPLTRTQPHPISAGGYAHADLAPKHIHDDAHGAHSDPPKETDAGGYQPADLNEEERHSSTPPLEHQRPETRQSQSALPALDPLSPPHLSHDDIINGSIGNHLLDTSLA